jgi:hypothetical protein
MLARPPSPEPACPAGPDLAGLGAGLGLDEAVVFANFGDPFWRLTCGGIYKIRSEDGEPIDFHPTPQQLVVLEEIYIHGSRTLVIPKARQVRMSTIIALIVLDTLLFGSSVQCSLCDIDIPNADRKLDEKVFFAFERLPEALKGAWTPIKKSLSPGIFTIQHGDDPTSKSTFYAGQKARGGTNQIQNGPSWPPSTRPCQASTCEALGLPLPRVFVSWKVHGSVEKAVTCGASPRKASTRTPACPWHARNARPARPAFYSSPGMSSPPAACHVPSLT